LEIGINFGPPNYVEIAIEDRGNELILSLKTWKGLYEQQHIQNCLWKSWEYPERFYQRWTANGAIWCDNAKLIRLNPSTFGNNRIDVALNVQSRLVHRYVR